MYTYWYIVIYVQVLEYMPTVMSYVQFRMKSINALWLHLTPTYNTSQEERQVITQYAYASTSELPRLCAISLHCTKLQHPRLMAL